MSDYTISQLISRIDTLEKQVSKLRRVESRGWEINNKLTVAAATIPIDTLPQYARHLLIVTSTRTDRALGTDQVRMQINGLVGAVYDTQLAQANAAIMTVSETFAQTSFFLGSTNGDTATAGYYASNIAWLLDYADTTKAPTLITLGGRSVSDAAGNMYEITGYQKCRTVGAVTSLLFFPGTGPNFKATSQITVYGMG